MVPNNRVPFLLYVNYCLQKNVSSDWYQFNFHLFCLRHVKNLNTKPPVVTQYYFAYNALPLLFSVPLDCLCLCLTYMPFYCIYSILYHICLSLLLSRTDTGLCFPHYCLHAGDFDPQHASSLSSSHRTSKIEKTPPS